MRVFAHCAAVGIVAGGLVGVWTGTPSAAGDGGDRTAQSAAPGAAASAPRDAATVLGAARQALGGEKKLAAVKSFTATGRTRQVRGDNLVPIEFEIFVELPDKYFRKDEIPAQETGASGSGFNGEDLLVDPTPPAPLPDPVRKARVATLKQDFARLALGVFAGSFANYPLTFTYVGQAEAPQGKADVLDAKGPDNLTLRYFINSETHLPIMVSWQPPAGRAGGPGMPGGPRPPEAPAPPPPSRTPPMGAAAAPAPLPPPPSPAAPGAAGVARSGDAAPRGGPPAAGAPRPELRVYFADYREVDGMQWPFRLRRATGAETTEETTFDRIKINPKIDPRKFDVRK
jgi:hypothetical protein